MNPSIHPFERFPLGLGCLSSLFQEVLQSFKWLWEPLFFTLFKTESPRWVLGLDTVVEVDGKVLGKPAGPAEAESMLRLLSGRVHNVFTGIALLVERGRPIEQEVVQTEVKFRQLAESELHFYLDSGEWAGAAGGYRIQERGAFFVEWIRGSYSNVVGLPLEAFYGILVRNEYQF